MRASLLILLWIGILCASPVFAQKGKDPKKGGNEEPAKTNPKNQPPKNTDPKSQDNKDARLANLGKLSRDEKNTMTRCPLHGNHMPLSEEYRANASDFSESEEHPFAKQLNYRRYCSKCTGVMVKEEKEARKLEKEFRCKETFARCEIHNVPIICNPDFNPNDTELRPDKDFPHAKQYKSKGQCKTCSKLYTKQFGEEEKEEKKKK
jgi:hypothetical protein